MALAVEDNEMISNVSVGREDLSGSERIVRGLKHKPLLFTFLYNKRNKDLDYVLSNIEFKTKITREQVHLNFNA